jgi:hypothetical protein
MSRGKKGRRFAGCYAEEGAVEVGWGQEGGKRVIPLTHCTLSPHNAFTGDTSFLMVRAWPASSDTPPTSEAAIVRTSDSES